MKYSEEQTKQLIELYAVNKDIAEIAETMSFSERSIIAKLSKLGLYEKPARTTKTGDPIVSKLELVTELQEITGLELPTLLKAHKADLKLLVEWLNGQTDAEGIKLADELHNIADKCGLTSAVLY